MTSSGPASVYTAGTIQRVTAEAGRGEVPSLLIQWNGVRTSNGSGGSDRPEPVQIFHHVRAMESCAAGLPERSGPVEVDDIRRDLLDDFTALPPQDSLQDNLQVYLRVRPLAAAESSAGGPQGCVSIEGPDTVVLKAPRGFTSSRQSDKPLPQTAQRFTFTQVFEPEASQRRVFEGSVRGSVRDVLEGGNCLVFTYGVTNAGKTFTFLGPDHDGGLLPRSLALVFSSVGGRLYGRGDLKPQRCRDYSRLTPTQQEAESCSKRNLLRLFKESDKSLTSTRSLLLNGSSLSTDSSVSDGDSFCLDVSSSVRFSVWVSFCEIYNDNIHDLLEQVPSGHHKRTTLRLSQDVKGNSFIKGSDHSPTGGSPEGSSRSHLLIHSHLCVRTLSDLRWVQVSSAEEAFRVMKIGKKNQSFSATRLNQLSSRSHSIFSIRILRVDDVGVPRVLGISELALCDLAGSERCSRTHNTGERLKEAGNINSSLLALGKCITAMRLNQHAKFQQHIPFRESKLTHFLQFFFCGAGRVSMVVNISQSASCYDETLNVLKFSALAQKVVVLNSRPVAPDDAPHRSAMELSLIIDEAERRRNVCGRGRRSSMVAWETTLEDVLEDEDGEGWSEEEGEDSVMEGTVLEPGAGQEAREAALRLVLEAQIREEVHAEFSELFSRMEQDYRDSLEKEREILEERADRRIQIFKNLVSRTNEPALTDSTKEEPGALEGIINSLTEDLEKIREDAQNVQHCLTEHTHPEAELAALRLDKQRSHEQLQEAQERLQQLMGVCLQKDQVISTLQTAADAAVEDATRDRALVESIRAELLQLQTCLSTTAGDGPHLKEGHKRLREPRQDEEPASKRVVLEEEIWRLQEENDRKQEVITQLRDREESSRGLEAELRRQEEEVGRLKEEQLLLEQRLETLTDLEACPNCDSVFASLEGEQKETARLTKENKALVNGIFQLQTEVSDLQTRLQQQMNSCDSVSEQLSAAQTRLQELEGQSEEKAGAMNSLRQEVALLRQEVQEAERRCQAAVVLQQEAQAALESSVQQVVALQDVLAVSSNTCAQLREEAANQKAEVHQLQSLKTGLEREVGALRRRLEAGGVQNLLAPELHENKENLLGGGRIPVVEELKEELLRLQERRGRQQGAENSGAFEAVRRERGGGCGFAKQEVHASPLRSNMADRKDNAHTTGRKRKSCQVEELLVSDNKRNRLRRKAGNKQSSVVKRGGGPLQKIEDLIHSSPRLLSGTAKALASLVGGQPEMRTALRRGRRKLYEASAAAPLLDSPLQVSGEANQEKESDHMTMTRQLRSKTCRK
ncbi:kinesin-like protein KIF20B [Antennarius striatus]|uniref:kinesin-like protein KIF20B n=1 Tax=Antennarius striatus TaxID=241820 RepID=UPI0035B2425F